MALLTDLTEYLESVPLTSKDYQKAIARMTNLQLIGGGVFDALIAQAALKAGVDKLLTWNPKDFIRLGNEIAVLVKVPE